MLISIARLDRLFFATDDPKSGGVNHGPKIFESNSCHHKSEIHTGLLFLKKNHPNYLKKFISV